MSSKRQVLEAMSGLMLGLFAATLSSTVVSAALPKMLRQLHGSQSQYTWVVTAVLLTATASTPIWGKLADLHSKKTLVQIALLVYVGGSMLAGLVQNAGELIVARGVQGVGAGGLQALVQIAVAALIPPRERGKYSGYLSSVTAVATIGGPMLGGFMVDASWLGWRWCFFIGVPFSVIALILLQLTLRLPAVRRADVKIDYLGAALITAGVSVLLIWVSFVDVDFGWVSWQSVAMVGVSLTLLAFAVRVESRAAEPIVPLHIVRQRVAALAILGSLASGTAMYGASVFLIQYFQLSRGHSPSRAGMLTIPMMAGILLASITAGRLVSRTGKLKPFLVAGTSSLTAGFAILGFIDERTSILLIGAAMVLIGAGVGMTAQNFVLIVQNAVPLKDMGASSATVTFFRTMGGTIGVAVLGAVFARQVAGHLAGGTPYAYGVASAHVFGISASVAAIGVLAALLFKPVTLRGSLELASSQPSAPPAPPATDLAAAA